MSSTDFITISQLNSALEAQKAALLSEFAKLLSASAPESHPAKKAKKAKKIKDPNAPKKPLAAFMVFSKEKRPVVKAEFPELKTTEISKKLGEMWGQLSDEEKLAYKQTEPATETEASSE